jgi:hypothetical protein
VKGLTPWSFGIQPERGGSKMRIEGIPVVEVLTDGQNTCAYSTVQPYEPNLQAIRCGKCDGLSDDFYLVCGVPLDEKRLRKMSEQEIEWHKKTVYVHMATEGVPKRDRIVVKHCASCGAHLQIIVQSLYRGG